MIGGEQFVGVRTMCLAESARFVDEATRSNVFSVHQNGIYSGVSRPIRKAFSTSSSTLDLTKSFVK